MVDTNKNSKELQKICGICGDKSIGYNFNAITCESCKAFFRRNALKNKELKCPFEGKCNIDLITRKFCQKCRLKKCFDIGMKKEWILTEEEKQIKRRKIAENRQKRLKIKNNEKVADSTTCMSSDSNNSILHVNSNELSITSSSNTVSFKQSNGSPIFDFQNLKQFNTDLISSTLEPGLETHNRYDNHSDEIQNSVFISKSNHINNQFCDCNITCKLHNDHEFDNNDLKSKSFDKIDLGKYDSIDIPEESSHINNQINEPSDIKIIGNQYNNCLESKIEIYDSETSEIPEIVFKKSVEIEFANIPIRKSNNETKLIDIIGLTDLENEKLSELSNATKAVRHSLASITSETTGLVDALKMTDQAVRKFIKMAKKINSFKSLCQSDQITLLKIGCPEMLILRSIVSFNFETEYWTVNKDKDNATLIKLDILKQAKQVNIYDAHKKFMISFKQEWNGDEHILNLCTAIQMFSSNRANLIHKQVIKLEQQTYMYLLQRYLEVKYSSKCEAKNRFLKLMAILEDLHRLSEDHVRIYLDVDPKHVGPLLIEIFDLKH